ncbi:hypothetical protein IEQ34_010147 [Dendrobium chrysotoxum]|uniref:Uncharacterized protein n=1 Tax=Dendrobium chrysotoxum TaxID=161865 RepID=A0AAV7H401_DENCH|nr:hypothetical protein IEQ34_010147 [Dendrobium chrysotoxum]
MRSGLRSACALLRRPVNDKTAKWGKIAYLGITTCMILSIYHLSRGHKHTPEPPHTPICKTDLFTFFNVSSYRSHAPNRTNPSASPPLARPKACPIATLSHAQHSQKISILIYSATSNHSTAANIKSLPSIP